MATKKKAAAKTSSKTPKEAATEMVVIVSGDRPLKEVTKDLKSAGFKVGQVLEAIGQVTGSAASGRKKQLKAIRGVADVSEAHEDFNIGPPDAPVS